MALALVATGALVVFVGLSMLSIVAAFVIAGGATIATLGLLAVELPQP